MQGPRLGEVRLSGKKPLPFLGQNGERYFCIKTEPNRSQVKLEFEKRGMSCVNTWGSPPGIYPGISECGPDGKPIGCEPPAPPKQMGRRSLHDGPHHRHLGAGKNCCRVPGTDERPCFDYNPTTQRCGLTWMDTSTTDYPECVEAPPGYGGAYVPNAAQGAAPGTGGDEACPPGQFRPGPGQPCRGSTGNLPNMGRARMGQPQVNGWLPPSCGPSQTPTPVVGGCALPPGYGPIQGGGAPPGKAVLACQSADGTFTVYPYTGGAAIASGVTQDCLNQFGDVTMASPNDTRCGGGSASGSAGACNVTDGKQYVMCPPSNGIAANYIVDPETGDVIVYNAGPECSRKQNIHAVSADSPYCNGAAVQGGGAGSPALVACWKGYDQYDVHSGGSDFALLASGLTEAQIAAQFPGKKYITAREGFCTPLINIGTDSTSPPPSSPSPSAPVNQAPGAPPTVNTQPPYEGGPPVLPPPQNFTTSSMPTGAWPGAPFSAMPPVQQPMKAVAPVPRPEACPLGPVPVAEWATKCALSKLN